MAEMESSTRQFSVIEFRRKSGESTEMFRTSYFVCFVFFAVDFLNAQPRNTRKTRKRKQAEARSTQITRNRTKEFIADSDPLNPSDPSNPRSKKCVWI